MTGYLAILQVSSRLTTGLLCAKCRLPTMMVKVRIMVVDVGVVVLLVDVVIVCCVSSVVDSVGFISVD